MERIKRLWRRATDRHQDGSKHVWTMLNSVDRHLCEWDYCHCYNIKCDICGDYRLKSSGVMEVR